MDRMNELKNCNAIKTILMCFVVLYHSMLIYGGGGWGPYQSAEESKFFCYIAKLLNSFHIYGFTLISGYIFYYIKYEAGGYQKYLPFLKNKSKRLLVPYIFFAILWVVPIDSYFWGTKGLISKYIFGTSPSQLWFLLMLFWAFAIFWLISNIVNKKPLLGGLIVCIAYCAGLFAPNYFCFSIGLQYLLFFYIGFIMRKCDLGNKVLYKIPSIVCLVVSVGLFVICEVLAGYEDLTIKVISLGCNVLLHIIGAVSAFVLLQRFVNRFLEGNKIIDFFGKHSMVIYLIHQQLVYFSIGWFNGVVPPVILVLINFVFSLTLSTIFSVLMHKTKITRFMIGAKECKEDKDEQCISKRPG